MATVTKAIRVEYERPPLRAIYLAHYCDEGQTDTEVAEAFGKEKPNTRIRKISRHEIRDEGDCQHGWNE